MTIAIAIRTGSAVVFAADSKITTVGIVGLDEQGKPRMVDQTYDNATKVVHNRDETVMAMIAGHANIGQGAATDFISRTSLGFFSNRDEQDNAVTNLVGRMRQEKANYWSETKVPPENWPGPTVILAAPGADHVNPRVWRIELDGTSSEVKEILSSPGIRLEGAYEETFGLLYGTHPSVLKGMAEQAGFEVAKLWEAGSSPKVLRPVDKMNFWSMPLQDAIDMAVFLANVQVEMDRFLPGIPACGGPIDVMALRMAPAPEILSYAGKALHHPASHG